MAYDLKFYVLNAGETKTKTP